MFDKLVESTKQRPGMGAGRYFAITCIVYSLALLALGVGTIVTFSPVLAEEYGLVACLAPPPPPPGKPQVEQSRKVNLKSQPEIGFVAPKKPIDDIPLPSEVPARIRPIVDGGGVDGAPYAFRDGTGVPGAPEINDATPPPPPVTKPTPKPDPPPSPVRQQAQRVSEGVLQGKAIHRVKPAYPQMAKAIRASGPVQVQVTISEEGRVIEAVVLGGHPTLRDAAREAARQWVFSPTTLSNVPVKVQGILTFNFRLD